MDFFNNTNNNEKTNSQDDSGFWDEQNEKAAKIQAQHDADRRRYTIELPQSDYDVLNKSIASSEDPEGSAYKMATAMKLSRMYDIPLSDAVNNCDRYVDSLYNGQKKDPKSAFYAVSDALALGNNNLEAARIGSIISDAESKGDTQLAQQYVKRYKIIQDDNTRLQDNTPRSWITEILKAGAQSLPYTLESMAAGAAGGLVAGPVGVAAAYGVGFKNTYGLEYMDLRADGADPDTARGVAAVSSGLQSLVETALGDVNRYVLKGVEIAGGKALKPITSPVINKIVEHTWNKMHFGAAFKTAARTLTNMAAENAEEGTEEVVQELISIAGKSIAADIDKYESSDTFRGMDTDALVNDLVQQFKGGFMGSIMLGIPVNVSNVKATYQDYKAVKDAAENVQSEEAFKKTVKDSPVFEMMDADQKSKTTDEIWIAAGKKREENADKEAADIAEVTSAADGMEEIQEDADGNEVVTPAVFDEGGKLHEEDKAVSVDDDGTAHGLFSAGNPEEKEKNTYGTIAYTESADGKTVTIDSFKMAAGREGLRQQLYSDFAEKFSGEDIQWNPQGERGKAVKADIMRANPRSGAGLNYFSDDADIADGRARISIGTQLHKYMPKITAEQLPSAISLAEYLAKGSGKSISQFIDDNFSDGKILTDTLTGENAEITQAQSGTVYGATQFMADNRAVIYATKNSDFNTWAHELFHVAQHGFTDEENAKIEAVIGKNVSDFTTDDFEKCADMFVDYLRGQQTQHAELKNVFQKVAQFIAGIFRGFQGKIAISKDISDTYDALLRGDGSELAAAEQAVSEAEKQWEKNGSEKTEQKKPENKPAGSNTGTGTGADGTGEGTGSAGDTADTENKNNAGVDNGSAERSGVSEERNGTHLSADAQERIDDTVSDPDMPSAEKAAVVMDETAKQYMKDAAEELLFQSIGPDGAQHLDQTEETSIRIDNLSAAREMEKAGRDARAVRLATGWERGTDGKWRYEIPDIEIRKNAKFEDVTADVLGEKEEYKKIKLADLIDDKGGLLKAYPELAGYDLIVQRMDSGTTGYMDVKNKAVIINRSVFLHDTEEYASKENSIENTPEWKEWTAAYNDESGTPEEQEKRIDEADKKFYATESGKSYIRNNRGAGKTEFKITDESRSVLIHELQHAVQTFEGFAKGGSLNTRSYVAREYDRIYANGLIKQMSSAREEFKKHFDQSKSSEIADALYEYHLPAFYRDASYDETVKNYEKVMESLSDDDYELVEKIWKESTDEKTEQELEKFKNIANSTAGEAYKKLAGETEARNAQYRIGMTDEVRRNTLLADTADVAPEDQIVLMASSMTPMSVLFQTEENSEKKIDQLIRSPDRKSSVKISVSIGSVSPALAENAAKYGYDIADCIHTVDNFFVNHVEINHYDTAEENRRGNIAVTDDDIKNLPYIYSNPDFIIYGAYTKQGNKAITYVKNEGDTTVFVEEVRTGKKELAAKTLFKRSGTTDVSAIKAAPSLYAQSVSPDIFIVDVKKEIVNRENGDILFQTEDELAKDAATFDTWQNFMEYYQGWAAPADAFIPSDADAAWFQNFWQNAKNIHPTLAEAEDARLTESEKQDEISQEQPEVKDAYFTSMIGGKGKLESFLTRVQQVLDEVPASNPEDETEAAENDKLLAEQRFIRTQLAHGTWLSNAMRVAKGGELTQQTRARMLTLIRKAARDYRGIYSVIMDDPSLAVAEYENFTEKLAKNDLASGEDTILTSSPEQRRKLSEKVKNREIAQKIRDGTLKLNDDVSSYVDNLQKQIKESDKKLQDLTDQTKEDYQRISDWQQRQILDKYDELQRSKLHYPLKSDQTARHLEKGLKIGKKYDEYQNSGFTADYDTLFRQYSDLLSATQISEELKAAIKRREQLADVAQDNHDKKQEKAALDQVKDMRKQLVKRTMRRVDFKRIDYENAKTVIAIQRIFEPNLFGGVNKWIGTEGVYPRQVWSQWSTDADARDRITKLLDRSTSGRKLIKLLEDTKTEDDFNAWTKKDRQMLYKRMPKEDWIRELNLQDLADERENSIQLDIDTKDNTRTYTDPKTGKQMTEVQSVATFSPEIEKMVRDALGPDTFENLVHRPFAEWTTEEMEDLARKVDKLYTEGRDKLAAKKQAEKEHARAIRDKIEANVKNVGIQVNPDDPDDVKKKKLEAINRKLGLTSTIKGTVQDATKRESILNRVQHFYGDANIRRVARILDNYSEGVNTNMLYWRENECYKAQESQIQKRTDRVLDAMKAAGVTMPELFETVTFKNFRDGTDIKLTRDELLFYLAASEDEHSRDACAYGSMIDEKYRGKYRDMDAQADAEETERLKNLKDAEKRGDKEAIDKYSQIAAESVDADGNLIPPGTAAYKADCDALYEKVLAEARKLDKKYLSLLKAVDDDYTESYERLNRASIDEFNAPVWRVDKYVPLIRLSTTGDTNENRVRQDLMGLDPEAQKRAGVDKGTSVKRVDISPLYQRPVEAGLYKTWADSVQRNEHFIAYAGYVRELNAVYGSRDASGMKQWIESRYGKGMTDYISNYINEVADPDAGRQQSELDKMVRTLRGHTAPAYLAWKASSIVKQAITSPAPFFQFVSPLEYASAAARMTNGKTADFIREKSVFMKNRVYDPMIDLVNENVEKSANKAAYTLHQFQATGMKGLEMIDWACVAPGWLAVYDKERAKVEAESQKQYEAEIRRLTEENTGKTGEDRISAEKIQAVAEQHRMMESDIDEAAVNKADDCTRLCQPSDRSTDLAPLFKTKGKNSEVVHALLQFQTSLNVIWQNIRYDIPYAARQKQYRQIIGMVAGYMFAGIALGMVCDKPDTDDDKEKKIRKFIYDSTTQFSDSVPVIGAGISALNEKMITGHGGWQSGNDIFPMITKYSQAAGAFTKGDWEKACGRFAEGTGLAFGLPISGLKEAGKVAGIGADGPNPGALLGRR